MQYACSKSLHVIPSSALSFGMTKETSAARGGCPQCGKTIPLAKATLRRGRPFTCAGCGSAIVAPKAPTSLAIACVLLLLFLSKQVALGVVVILLVAGMLAEWLLAKVQLAKGGISTQ